MAATTNSVGSPRVLLGVFILVQLITITHSQEDVVEDSIRFVPDEYIVTLREDLLTSTDESWLQSFVAKIKDQYGCQVKRNISIGNLKSFVIKGEADNLIQKLEELNEVAFIDRNYYVSKIGW